MIPESGGIIVSLGSDLQSTTKNSEVKKKSKKRRENAVKTSIKSHALRNFSKRVLYQISVRFCLYVELSAENTMILFFFSL